MKNIKYFLLISFLLFPLLSKADVWDNAGKVLIPMYAFLINLPVIVIFFIARNYWNKGKQLKAFLIIGITWTIYFGICCSIEQLHTFFSDPFVMASWIPITIIFILFGSAYFLKRLWDSYPNE